jgi:protein TonB
MIKNTIFIVFILFLQFSKAQETISETNEDIEGVAFTIIESVPIYPGCENTIDKRGCFQNKIQEHIKSNFRYPRKALKENIQGKVFVSFIIEKDGEIKVHNARGAHEILEKEARRIIEKMPKVIPGTQKGEPVRMTMSIPINFKI